jgi:phage gpG-like protein
MAVFFVKINNMRALQKNVNRLSKELSDFKVLNKMRIVGMDQFIEKNFQKEGQLVQDGGWKPITKKTIQARRNPKRKRGSSKNTQPPKILQDMAWMKNRRHPEFSNKIAKIVFDMPYAKVHQKGSKKKGIPKREIFNQKAYAKTGKDQKIIDFWFKKQVKEAGNLIRRTIGVFR